MKVLITERKECGRKKFSEFLKMFIINLLPKQYKKYKIENVYYKSIICYMI